MLEGNDFTNTELVNLQAEKVWKIGEDDITTIIRNASVTLKLQQKIDEGEWEDVELSGLTNQQTLSVGNTADANAWKAIWNGLPKYARVEENDVLIMHTLEDLFPEIKESEDEKIMKGLIDYFSNFHLQTSYNCHLWRRRRSGTAS